jgi:AdoMet-dependent heme synthase
MDFNKTPFIAIWETTQACDLACIHCRACAQPLRSPLELSTEEAKDLINQAARMSAPLFVLTGGDPLKRPDIYTLVEYGTRRRVRMSMTPSATPLLTHAAVARLRRCGLARLAVSLDGSTAEIHDAFRGVSGSYDLTLKAVRWTGELGLPVQINTTITRRNLADFESMVALLKTFDMVLWSVFFLVPTGRGQLQDLVSAEEFEEVFARLAKVSQGVHFDIKTTEAQHYRRYLAQQRAAQRRSNSVPVSMPFDNRLGDGIGRAPRGVNDGKGIVFISHEGDVFPSGFLPLAAGNIRRESLAEIYRNAPLFKQLRDTSNLKGKCGRCEFREICGGSRSRAYALTGDPFQADPSCVYQPPATRTNV